MFYNIIADYTAILYITHMYAIKLQVSMHQYKTCITQKV